jgi:mercuric ion binding protein
LDIVIAIRKYLFHGIVLAMLFAGSVQAWAASVHSFKVDGLACPFCSYGVEKQLKTIPGVSGVRISIKTSTVTVTMKDGMKLSKAQADRAVKDAGFTMRNFR